MKLLRKIGIMAVAVVMLMTALFVTACGGDNAENNIENVMKNTLSEKPRSIEGKIVLTEKYGSSDKDKSEWREKGAIDAVGDLLYGDFDISQTYSGYTYLVSLRDWIPYVVESFDKDETPDFSKMYVRSGYALPGFSLRTIEMAPRANYILMSLAKSFDAYTQDGDTITIDGNKLAFNIKNKLIAVKDGLKDTTTIKELLDNETVKAILSSIVDVFSAEELAALLKYGRFFTLGLNGGQIYKWLSVIDKVKPDENSTAYDYIKKLITSDETYAVLSKAVEEQAGVKLPAKIQDLTLGFMLDTIRKGYTVENLKEDLTEYCFKAMENSTETKFVYSYSDYLYEFSNVKATYTVANGKIVKQNAVIQWSRSYDSYGSPGVRSIDEYNITLDATFSDKAPTLKV